MEITSLVTGGAGFIGSHVVDHLLELKHRVIVLDDLSGGDINNINRAAQFYEGSILDTRLIEKLFKKYKFTYVYHLAAYAAEGLSPFIRNFNYQNNLVGSINLINAAVNYKVRCFVFTSSIAVYGEQDPPLSESGTPQPVDPYGIAKFAVELDLLNAHKMFGLDYIIFRPHNVYGVRQNIGDRYRNVVGIFMNQLLNDQPLTIFGDGQQTRAFTHIDDVAPYIADSVNIPATLNNVFNLGSDQVYSVNELAEAVQAAMRIKAAIAYLAAREEVVHAYASHQKFKEVFRPRKSQDLASGLAEMAAWVTTHGARKSKSFDPIEISKNLPDSWKTK